MFATLMNVCVCARVCVRVCLCVCMHACYPTLSILKIVWGGGGGGGVFPGIAPVLDIGRACKQSFPFCLLPHLPIALGHVIGHQEHTQSIGFAPIRPVCVEDLAAL